MITEHPRRYSQAFKQKVVREYETGESIYRLRKKYGIGAHRTVEQWVRRYGRSGYRSELVIIQTVDDQLEVQAMKQRITELEAALAQSVLDNRMLTTTIDVASQSLEIDLKKNFGKRS